jgi:hypothetical protein
MTRALTLTPERKPFDYSALDDKTADLARRVAEKIRADHRRTIRTIINTGVDLLGIKGRLGHGHFGAWLAAEFDWTERTAQRFMAAAEAFRDNPDTVSDLPPTMVYALAAPSTPTAIRQEVVTRHKGGEPLPPKDIQGMIADARSRERMAKAEAKVKAKRRRQKRPVPDFEKQRLEAEQREAAQKVAAGRAAAWVTERGDPAELLALLNQCYFFDFLESLRTTASAAGSDGIPAFIKGRVPVLGEDRR